MVMENNVNFKVLSYHFRRHNVRHLNKIIKTKKMLSPFMDVKRLNPLGQPGSSGGC